MVCQFPMRDGETNRRRAGTARDPVAAPLGDEISRLRDFAHGEREVAGRARGRAFTLPVGTLKPGDNDLLSTTRRLEVTGYVNPVAGAPQASFAHLVRARDAKRDL